MIIIRKLDPSGPWSTVGTIATDTNGFYTFIHSESEGVHTYEASVAGESTYSGSYAGCSVTARA